MDPRSPRWCVDQYGQVIDVSVSPRPDTGAARRFFEAVLVSRGRPAEVVTDKTHGAPRVAFVCSLAVAS